jgi:uncharacterized protein (TIGR02646 family)
VRFIKRVTFSGPAWDAWRKHCEQASAAVNAEPTSRSSVMKRHAHVYKDAMPFLLKLFGDKCVYCEAPFDSGRGEVEHFRPKLRTSDAANRPIKVHDDDADADVTHGGYYWLAFSWNNLLLGCTNCNQPPAKANKFPVRDESRRAWRPDSALEDEEPLLLDPSRDDPAQHLDFDTSGESAGYVIPLKDSARGRESIEVYRLNRDGLIQARKSQALAIAQAENVFVSAQNLGDDQLQDAIDDIRRRCQATQPFSALWTQKTRHFLEFAEARLAKRMEPVAVEM